MWSLNQTITKCFDGLFGLMESWPGWASLLVLSAIFGICALVAYKYTSNQDGITRVHDDIKANLLAIKLFKDNFSVTFKSQMKLFWAAARMFGLSLQPLAVMIIPMALLIIQMAHRYEWRPLTVGESTLLTVEFKPEMEEVIPDLKLTTDESVIIECGPSRAFNEETKEHKPHNAARWRLHVTAPGRHVITIKANGETATKELVASTNPYVRVSPIRAGSGFWNKLLWPVEKPAAENSSIQQISVDYTNGKTLILGWDIHWIITLMIASMIIAVIIKPFFKVQLW